MVKTGHSAFFETFGFLALRQVFSPVEMETITGAAEEIWAVEEGLPEGGGEYSGATAVAAIFEKHPMLTSLVEDDRIYNVIEHLLGPGFIWAGSEGQIGRISTTWHNDRPGKNQNTYTRLKAHIYLDPTTKETGALRVIPGSHRSPYHDSLKPLMQYHIKYEGLRSKDESKPSSLPSLPFGVVSSDIPSHAIESNPGDVIIFHQNAYHAVYGGLGERRRYIAMKFAAKPMTEEHINLIKENTAYIFHPHEAFLKSKRPRIQSMVKNLES